VNKDTLARQIEADREHIVEAMNQMLRIRAVGPDSGGEGEYARAEYLVRLLGQLGLSSFEVLESPDLRVPRGSRPNVVVRLAGRNPGTICVVAHLDTVTEGDVNAWDSPPFEPRIADGRIYARGAEDNGQALMASLFGLASLVKAGIVPELEICLVFVSDEEHGNKHGIEFLLSKGLFRKGDLIVVPDHGSSDGSEVEVIEKGIVWVDVEVIGEQTHASTPHKGVNAFEAACRFVVSAADCLRNEYSSKDSLFDPPFSTFEATRCEFNSSTINTVPGRQRFAFDFRVLPEYRLDDVLARLREVATTIEGTTGATVKLNTEQRTDAAPRTDTASAIVQRLSKAISLVKSVETRPVGIGGGTCANPFRREGFDAVVWETVDGVAHDANEYCVIDNLISDTKVFAMLFAGDALEP